MHEREIGDRLEIEETLRKYAFGLDQRNFKIWTEVFTADAIIDFTPMGGLRETPTDVSVRLGADDPDWMFAQHPLYNTIIAIDGDQAWARSEYGMESGRRVRRGQEIFIKRISGGGSYRDRLIRSADGWRIEERVVALKWKRIENVAEPTERS